MYFYIAIVIVLMLCIKKIYLLKNYPLNLEFNEHPFTTGDLHVLNQNFNWPDYKGSGICD